MEKFLIIIPHHFEDDDKFDGVQVGDLSVYTVTGTFETVEEKMVSMLNAGYFETYILVPMLEVENADDIEQLELSILRYRMETIVDGINE